MEFDKKFLARDFGLSIDALSISPENIEASYNFNREYNIDVKNNKLKVKVRDLDISEEYSFISDVEDYSTASNKTVIKKQDNRMIIK